MRLQNTLYAFSVISPCLAPANCPQCSDRQVAPESSEFVDSGEIRHHWLCDTCGEAFQTTVPLRWH